MKNEDVASDDSRTIAVHGPSNQGHSRRLSRSGGRCRSLALRSRARGHEPVRLDPSSLQCGRAGLAEGGHSDDDYDGEAFLTFAVLTPSYDHVLDVVARESVVERCPDLLDEAMRHACRLVGSLSRRAIARLCDQNHVVAYDPKRDAMLFLAAPDGNRA